jgi:hypothetical protein
MAVTTVPVNVPNSADAGYANLLGANYANSELEQFYASLRWNYLNYIRAKFQELAKSWKANRRSYSSSTDALINHTAYRKIVALGPVAIPFILEELQKEPDHWFPALAALAKENPVSPEARGDLVKMTKIWLAWGIAKGHV